MLTLTKKKRDAVETSILAMKSPVKRAQAWQQLFAMNELFNYLITH
jgi:hypothetical protein